MQTFEQQPSRFEALSGPEVIRLTPAEVEIPELPETPTVPYREEYDDPRFVRDCENVLKFFLDKPNFSFTMSGVGSYIRDAAGVEFNDWGPVANELLRVSGAMVSVKSEEAKQREKPNRKVPNDTFFINPDVILAGGYPYFTDEIKSTLAEKMSEAEQNN